MGRGARGRGRGLMDNDEKLRAFLTDLSELSQKHHLYIGGCGCCGSPFVYRLTEGGAERVIADLLSWQGDHYKAEED